MLIGIIYVFNTFKIGSLLASPLVKTFSFLLCFALLIFAAWKIRIKGNDNDE